MVAALAHLLQAANACVGTTTKRTLDVLAAFEGQRNVLQGFGVRVTVYLRAPQGTFHVKAVARVEGHTTVAKLAKHALQRFREPLAKKLGRLQVPLCLITVAELLLRRTMAWDSLC
jgi:hypothetical protein